MKKTSQVPLLARPGNVLMTAMVRVGFKLGPICLITVRGLKSGQPRTTPIAIVEQDGKRYVSSPYGVVDWVRNLRAAEEATLTHGRHSETVRARELSPREGGLVLKALITGSGPFDRYFGVAPGAPLEDFDLAAQRHPVFLLQNAN